MVFAMHIPHTWFDVDIARAAGTRHTGCGLLQILAWSLHSPHSTQSPSRHTLLLSWGLAAEHTVTAVDETVIPLSPVAGTSDHTRSLTPAASIQSTHRDSPSSWHSGLKIWRMLLRSRELWPLSS